MDDPDPRRHLSDGSSSNRDPVAMIFEATIFEATIFEAMIFEATIFEAAGGRDGR